MKLLRWFCSRGLHWYIESGWAERTCSFCHRVEVRQYWEGNKKPR